MISFQSWFRTCINPKTPWVVLGKGPSFSRHSEIEDLEDGKFVMGLNHVCRVRSVFVTHVIDAEVLGEIESIEDRTDYLVMPWHPHVGFRSSVRTLEDFVDADRSLSFFANERRLLWYNLSSWAGSPNPGSDVIKVNHFSAEAAIGLLGSCGVKTVYTLGIDGGNKYAREFSDLKPLRGGNTTFNVQDQDIQVATKKYGIDLRRL